MGAGGPASGGAQWRGVSAKSGVPTFRDTHTGYWAQFDPQEMASDRGFRMHPERVWQWYSYRRDLLAKVQPNAAA